MLSQARPWGASSVYGVAAVAFLMTGLLDSRGKQTYVGSETCRACHQDLYDSFQKNRHHRLETDTRRGWETKGCEACHGPGVEHADSASPTHILNPARLPADQADHVCLECHLNQPTHIGRIQGGHAKNEVQCPSCHFMHQEPVKLVRRAISDINTLCAGCHSSSWAEFQRPHKHKLPEGAMSCVDCHNPHGSFLQHSLQASFANETGCLRCHSDKRGPFTFEHAPVRLEGCSLCHEPHGSANPRMLRRHEQRFLCLECHANIVIASTLGGIPPAFHDLRSARFRNCTVCHVKIHGSHVSRALLR